MKEIISKRKIRYGRICAVLLLIVLATLFVVGAFAGGRETDGAGSRDENRFNRPESGRPELYQDKDFDIRSVEEICAAGGIAFEDPEIIVRKSAYILELYSGSILVKEYPIALGANPGGDKIMEGDLRTPVGEYEVLGKREHKDWARFIWISYPEEQDRREFEKRKEDGEIPADARIGGEIGIHAWANDDWFAAGNHNWTGGCIGMLNADVVELYHCVDVGTPVLIME